MCVCVCVCVCARALAHLCVSEGGGVVMCTGRGVMRRGLVSSMSFSFSSFSFFLLFFLLSFRKPVNTVGLIAVDHFHIALKKTPKNPTKLVGHANRQKCVGELT